MMESTTQEMDECDLSIPRGGPIYIPSMMGPLTRVPEFENNVVLELQNLQAELCLDVSEICDDDISYVLFSFELYTFKTNTCLFFRIMAANLLLSCA